MPPDAYDNACRGGLHVGEGAGTPAWTTGRESCKLLIFLRLLEYFSGDDTRLKVVEQEAIKG